ncbi:hypothetical protein MMC14_000750 [Varicellaria rhodocarpa]|nr:hypothetical protein [Varicellaria rhodocarpa]
MDSRRTSSGSLNSLDLALLGETSLDAADSQEPTSDAEPNSDAEANTNAEATSDAKLTSALSPIQSSFSPQLSSGMDGRRTSSGGLNLMDNALLGQILLDAAGSSEPSSDAEPIADAESTSAPSPKLSNYAASVPLPPSPVSPSSRFTFKFINPKDFASSRAAAGSSQKVRVPPTPGSPSPDFKSLIARALGPAIEAEEAGSVRKVRMPRSRRLGASAPTPTLSTSQQLSPDALTFSALNEEQLRHQVITLMRERDEAIAARDQEVAKAEVSKQQQSSFLAATQANTTRIEKQYQKLSREEKDNLDRIETQEGTIQRLQNDLDATNQMVSQEKIRSGVSATALNNRNQQLKRAEDEIEVLRTYSTSLQAQFDNLKDQEKKIRNKVSGLEKQCRDSEAKLQDHPTEIAALKRERDEHKANKNVAETNLYNLNLKCKSLENERGKAEEEIERLQSSVDDLVKDEKKIHDKAVTYENLSNKLRRTIKELESQNATLQEKLASAKEEVSALPKPPINPPPSSSGDDDDDDEWSKKMTEFAGGERMPCFEEEGEEEDVGEEIVEVEGGQLAAPPKPITTTTTPIPQSFPFWILAAVLLIFYAWKAQSEKMEWVAANAGTKRAW